MGPTNRRRHEAAQRLYLFVAGLAALTCPCLGLWLAATSPESSNRVLVGFALSGLAGGVLYWLGLAMRRLVRQANESERHP
jgi:hypothetical protein